jgi:hypothetical protein
MIEYNKDKTKDKDGQGLVRIWQNTDKARGKKIVQKTNTWRKQARKGDSKDRTKDKKGQGSVRTRQKTGKNRGH